MAELIGALAEAIAGLFLIIAEALPAIAELLVYLVIGSVTLIAYALSRGFSERKHREWTERPARRYLDMGLSTVSLTLLASLALWIFLPGTKRPKGAVSSPAATAQRGGAFQVMISKRSDQNSNGVTMQITVKKGALSKLLHKKSRAATNAVTDDLAGGRAAVTNEVDSTTSIAGTNNPSSP